MYGDTLETTTGKITESSREMAKAALSVKESFLFLKGASAFDNAEQLGINLDLVTDAVLDNGNAYEELQKKFEASEVAVANRDENALRDTSAYRELMKAVDAERAGLEQSQHAKRQEIRAQGNRQRRRKPRPSPTSPRTRKSRRSLTRSHSYSTR